MKLLKNKLFAILGALLIMVSCNPLEDTYNELDAENEEAGSGVTLTYTLTSDDYGDFADALRSASGATSEDSVLADFVESYEAINVDMDPTDFLADWVNSTYPQYGKGTAVKVTYNYIDESIQDFSSYLSDPEYELTDEDYASVSDTLVGSAGFFFPSAPADDYIPEILADEIQDAVSGDIYAVHYEASSEDAELDYSTAGSQSLVDITFVTESIDNYFTQSVVGDQTWYISTSYGVVMNGYASSADHENEDWLVIQNIDLSNFTNATLSLNQAINYVDTEVLGTDIAIKVSTDFDGTDVTTASWDVLDLDVWPDGDSYTYFDSKASLSAYAGQVISIAFYYTSTDESAAVWEIKTAEVTAQGEGATVLSKSPVEHVDYYEYDGSDWELLEDVYTFNGDDYESLGFSYDDFSSSQAPANYIPQYLALHYPYAQEGDSKIIIYAYYASKLTNIAEQYTYTGGVWVGTYYDITTKTDQFVNGGSGFIFDPSVSITMASADYQVIVDYVADVYPDLVDATYGNAEYYYGASAYYEDFDMRLSYRNSGDYAQEEYTGLTAEQGDSLMVLRMGEGIQKFLEISYADATLVSGLEVYYTVTCETYDGSYATWKTVFLVTGTGEFELTEGPTQQ